MNISKMAQYVRHAVVFYKIDSRENRKAWSKLHLTEQNCLTFVQKSYYVWEEKGS